MIRKFNKLNNIKKQTLESRIKKLENRLLHRKNEEIEGNEDILDLLKPTARSMFDDLDESDQERVMDAVSQNFDFDSLVLWDPDDEDEVKEFKKNVKELNSFVKDFIRFEL